MRGFWVWYVMSILPCRFYLRCSLRSLLVYRSRDLRYVRLLNGRLFIYATKFSQYPLHVLNLLGSTVRIIRNRQLEISSADRWFFFSFATESVCFAFVFRR